MGYFQCLNSIAVAKTTVVKQKLKDMWSAAENTWDPLLWIAESHSKTQNYNRNIFLTRYLPIFLLSWILKGSCIYVCFGFLKKLALNLILVEAR